MLRRLLKPLILPTTLILVLLAGLFTAMDYYAALAPSTPPAGTPAVVQQDSDNSPQDDPEAPARDVAPDALLPRNDDRPLTRLPPRDPLDPPATEEETTQTSTLLHRPLAISAGVLSFGGRDLEIAGVVPTPPDRICTTEEGQRWPCGMVARTAFRNYLRGRSLECEVPAPEWEGTAEASCLMMDADLGLWLAESGWAEAEPASPYAEISDEAQQDRRGIFGADPR